MNKSAAAISILLMSLLLMASLITDAWAGSGVVTKKEQGSVVDLTVYFRDAAQSQDKWAVTFQEASKKLWKASHGLLRLGKIRMGTDPLVGKRSDITIGKDGGAYVSQPGTRNITSLGTEDTLYLYETDMGYSMITLHELGHYLFCLSDEYLSTIYQNKDGIVQVIDSENRKESYCSAPYPDSVNPHHSCLMYDNNYPDSFYMFCGSEHLEKNVMSDGRWAVTRQQKDNGKSCFACIMDFFKITTAPAVPTTEPPDTPEIIKLRTDARYSVMIQSNLSAAQMQQAQKLAVESVRRMRIAQGGSAGDSLGVATFSGAVEDLFGWEELKTQANVDSAAVVIGGIMPDTATPNLETSLRKEITSIVENGQNYSTRTILLYTNGPGSVSQTLIDDMRRNDVCVDVVALADNPVTKSLKSLAGQTGGSFTLALPAVKGMPRATGNSEAAAEDAGDHIIALYEGVLQPGNPISHTLPVDAFNDEITVDLTIEGIGPILVLKDPAGVPVDLDAPPSNVRVQKTDGMILVTVDQPSPGIWTAAVDGPAVEYALELSGSGDEMGESNVGEEPALFPQATIFQVHVANDLSVAGCQVQAAVTRPDGTIVTVRLYDDGDMAWHGDARANDGVYSTQLVEYSGSGSYEVEFQIVNASGQYTTDVQGVDVPPGVVVGPLGPCPPFQRLVYDSFVVEGAPAVGATALLAPGTPSLQCAALGQVTLNWIDPSGGQAETVIQRSYNGTSSFQEIGTASAGETTFTDTSAGVDGQVFYRLLARNAAGDSRASLHEVMDLERATMSFMEDATGLMPVVSGSGPGSSSPGGCFIATAAYGSPMHPHVRVLREFRDRYLLTSRPGRCFVSAYYAVSPMLARIIAPSPILRAQARQMLSPLIFSLEHPWAALSLMCIGICLGVLLYRHAPATRSSPKYTAR